MVSMDVDWETTCFTLIFLNQNLQIKPVIFNFQMWMKDRT